MSAINHIIENSTGELLLESYIGRHLKPVGCIVLICTEGHAVVSVNFMKYKFRKGDISFAMSDLSFSPLAASDDCRVKYVSLSAEVIDQTFFKLNSMTFWDYLYSYPVVTPSYDNFCQAVRWIDEMRWICENASTTNKDLMLSNAAFNFFMAYDSIITNNGYGRELHIKNRSWLLLGKFGTMLVKHCHKHREAGYYAKELCITPDYLYKITQKIMNMSPKQMIDMQVLSDIKSYLTDTDLSVKDIASEVGFEDPSYMCRFFRRMTGLSPLEFKNNEK